MVSGLVTSPDDHGRICSGEARPILMASNSLMSIKGDSYSSSSAGGTRSESSVSPSMLYASESNSGPAKSSTSSLVDPHPRGSSAWAGQIHPTR